MASKSKRRRKVLGASCILAALIIAGSSFAWFTSKDEVTNRLSANADYDVTISENFEPPANWIPGQTINKDAGATNTGNVDSFVRMWLDGEMSVLDTVKLANATAAWTQATSASSTVTNGIFAVADGTLVDVTDKTLTDLNLNKYYTDSNVNYYLKELSKTQTTNPNNSETITTNGYTAATSTAYSEVQAMQAGGILAYAPDNAEYTYVLNQATKLKIYAKSNATGASAAYTEITVPAGTLVHAGGTAVAATYDKDTGNISSYGETSYVTSTAGTVSSTAYNVVYVEAPKLNADFSFNPIIIEAETFTPVTKGLYLFARNEDVSTTTSAVDTNDAEFSGYYYTGGTFSKTTTAGTINTFYALKNYNDTNPATENDSDYTLSSKQVASLTGTDASVLYTVDTSGDILKVLPTTALEIYTAKYTVLTDSNFLWYYDTSGSQPVIHVVYPTGAIATSTYTYTDTDIIVDITLNNVGTGAEQWTAIGGETANTKSYVYPAVSGNGITTNASNYWGKDASLVTFYYNNDLESGDSTAKLVDSISLNSAVTQKAYLAFDFDLDVNLESVQVTVDESGKEHTTPVNTWATSTGNTGAKPEAGNDAKSYDGNEISVISWKDLGWTAGP